VADPLSRFGGHATSKDALYAREAADPPSLLAGARTSKAAPCAGMLRTWFTERAVAIGDAVGGEQVVDADAELAGDVDGEPPGWTVWSLHRRSRARPRRRRSAFRRGDGWLGRCRRRLGRVQPRVSSGSGAAAAPG
jgi:hypothetical protein